LGRKGQTACRITGLCRATWTYKPKSKRDDTPLREAILRIAAKRRRFGQERIHIVLRREGWKDGIKRVRRIYREEGLSLRLKRRRKLSAGVRVPMPAADRPNHTWSMDFVHDKLVSNRSLKCLTIVDEFTRECLAIEVDTGLNGSRVTRVLDQLIEVRGKPIAIRCDNGPEFASNKTDAWAYAGGLRLQYIQPGRPTQNAFIESFNGRFREECLNENQFQTLIEAQVVIDAWRKDYNEERPHGSLKGLTPSEFAARHTTNEQAKIILVPQLETV
jgi:putative transposase